MSWDAVETARCAGCGVYGDRSDLVLGPDGNAYCCGVPLDAYVVVTRRDVAPDRVARATRLIIGTMLLVTLAFPLAACCSQL